MRNRNNRQRGWPIEDSLIRWIEVTGPTALDRDLVEFLERELDLPNRKQLVASWQITFAELLGDQLAHGLSLHRLLDRLRPPTFWEMTRQALNSEKALCVALNACARSSASSSHVVWPNTRSFATMYNRQTLSEILVGAAAETTYGSSPLPSWDLLINGFPNNLNLEGQSLSGLLVLGVDFSESNLSRVEAFGMTANAASFSQCNLQNADLVCSSLCQAFFDGADLTHANLMSANLMSASLRSANLFEADLSRANLERANLEGANLRAATLEGANIERAKLESAGLGGANLVGVRGFDTAGLDAVASWRGAKIERKWVERLGLDAESLGLEVVDDVEDDIDDDLDDHQPAEE